MSQWLNANMFAEVYKQIIERYDEVVNPPVSREQFIELRDSVMHSSDISEIDFLNVASQVADVLRNFFHSDAYTPLLESEEMEEALEQRYAIYGALIGFNIQYGLSMPGHFTGFDSEPLRFTGDYLIPHDYTITASSRVVHTWAFVVTLLFIIVPLLVLWRRRNNN